VKVNLSISFEKVELNHIEKYYKQIITIVVVLICSGFILTVM